MDRERIKECLSYFYPLVYSKAWRNQIRYFQEAVLGYPPERYPYPGYGAYSVELKSGDGWQLMKELVDTPDYRMEQSEFEAGAQESYDYIVRNTQESPIWYTLKRPGILGQQDKEMMDLFLYYLTH